MDSTLKTLQSKVALCFSYRAQELKVHPEVHKKHAQKSQCQILTGFPGDIHILSREKHRNFP